MKPIVLSILVLAGAAAVAEDPFYLTGECSTDTTISSSTNATVTLDGWTSSGTLYLTTDNADGVEFTIKEKKNSVNKIEVKNNQPAIDAYGCDLVFSGKGEGKFISTKKVSKGGEGHEGIIVCRNLTVDGGDTTVKFDQDKPDTACVLVYGDFLQKDKDSKFKVSMPEASLTESNSFTGVQMATKNTSFTIKKGSFEANIGGVKSSGVALKKTCTANLNGGNFTVTLKGPQVRAINGGTINFAGTTVKSEIHEDYTNNLAGVAKAKLFNAEKAIAISGGEIDLDVQSVDTELLCCDDSMTITGGSISLVAGDDCINVQTNLVIDGGMIYAESLYGDGIDSNGDITINDGLVLAYALTGEEKGLDVNNAGVSSEEDGVLTINGGTVVMLGGPDSKFQGKDVFNQTCYAKTGESAETYSDKFLSLVGTNKYGSVSTTVVHLPEITNDYCTVLFTVPGFPGVDGISFRESKPTRGKLGFHKVWVLNPFGTMCIMQ